MSRTAIVAGSTGLVGGFLLDELCQSSEYSEVIALARAPRGSSHPKLHWQKVDFGALPELPLADVYSALGTTLERAGSRAAFRRVDHDFVVGLAERARQAGSPRFLLVSALGASEHSRVFYNRVKGASEAAVVGLGFERVCVFRPSLLLGPRVERRFGERLAQLTLPALSPLLRGRFSKYRPIEASAVARAMLRVALDTTLPPGAHIFESDEIGRLASSGDG